ncbi:hypothetical protein BT67DRAFT_315929 [Trichocladium antarcticum]|uniref:Uncharacterized protein n=1 Tax=Trichocladium antarcticum TaxID=1450529 RepID=A0AAN6UKF9_9PEZI|nr:hypothetical protein BT67DRAFT_315929 [Trichocladium antarcticum]
MASATERSRLRCWAQSGIWRLLGCQQRGFGAVGCRSSPDASTLECALPATTPKPNKMEPNVVWLGVDHPRSHIRRMIGQISLLLPHPLTTPAFKTPSNHSPVTHSSELCSPFASTPFSPLRIFELAPNPNPLIFRLEASRSPTQQPNSMKPVTLLITALAATLVASGPAAVSLPNTGLPLSAPSADTPNPGVAAPTPAPSSASGSNAVAAVEQDAQEGRNSLD